MRKKQFSDFSLRIFFGFWEQNFSDFRPKNFKKLSKLTSTWPEEHLWLEFFLSFEPLWIFCRNLWHGSQISIYVSRVKFAEEIFFLFFLSQFFRILSEKFSYFWPKNFKKFSKLSSTCPAEQFVAWNCSAWFSKFYLRVQSKNFGRNSFLFFFSEFFFGFWAKLFSDFRRKIFKKLSKLPSACPEEQFVAWNFFKSFESFWIFCSNHWHGSQNSIYVSRVKNAEKNMFFLFFFSEFFRILSDIISDFWSKHFKVFKTIFCVSRGTICGLNFFKFWIVSDFLQKSLAWFSKFYLRVQSKNCGKNSFFYSSFLNFFEVWAKIFQTFGQKTSRSFQNYLLRVQRNHLCL